MVNLPHAGSGLFVLFMLGFTRSTVSADPCTTEVRSFNITTTQDAEDLATALNCSGKGSFDVQWEGLVIVEETIALTDGSVVTITGVGSSAVADGNGTTQLFTVVNSTLNFIDVGLENGNGFRGDFSVTGGVGGAVWASGIDSVVSWSGTSTVANNYAGYGGAVGIVDGAKASWTGQTNFIRNSASHQGAVLSTRDGAIITFTGETTFSDNKAGLGGGAMDLGGSTVSWSGVTSFRNTTLTSSFEGGGTVYVGDSVLSWEGETSFIGGRGGNGGALRLVESNVSWRGNTVFCNNTADLRGGALYITSSSTVSGTGETHFCNNRAGDASDFGMGGAVYVDKSTIVMNGTTAFTGNYAQTGGAIYVIEGATLDLNETTALTNNAAAVGGALYAEGGAELSWGGEITFTENTARENGGALALSGEMSLDLTAAGIKLSFTGNNAKIAGGAVYQSGISHGLIWTGVTFVANSALNGGAVYSVASGTGFDQDDKLHSKYIDCIFRYNSAGASGGAVESAAGKDDFLNTTFEGNTAGAIGGALRMAGTTNLTLCEFVGNGADETGPAVASVGTIVVSNISFWDNGLLCAPGAFLNYFIEGNGTPDKPKQDYYASVCEGCSVCTGCTWEGEGTQECIPALENTESVGVDSFGVPITLETLEIQKGFWRPVANTSSIFPCWNADACLEGITDDTDDCADGYEGPYCAICEDDYAPTLAYTCAKCSSSDGIVFAVLTLIVGLVAVVAVSFHLVSEPHQTENTFFRKLRHALPVQGLKTVVVAWQILTQFDSVANVTYAGVYGQFLDGISSVISLDVGLVLSGSCLAKTDFHDRVVVSTLGPILVLVALAVSFHLAARRNHRSQEQWQRVRRKYFSMALLVTFLVYSSVSSMAFRVFDCESLHDGKEYLRADYSIQCTTDKHKALEVYAGFMIMLYPIGIPVLYGIILFKHREVLQGGRRSSVKQSTDVEVTVDLWKPYTPGRYYYEVVECARRVTLTGVVVFIYPNTASQVAVTLVLAFVFVMVSESLAPYASKQDAWLSRVGHIVVFLSMYQALVLKVDVSDESRESQQVFGGVLLAANVFMVAAVIAEATIVVCYVCGRGIDDLEESVAPGVRATASTRSVADNWDTIDIEDAPAFKGTLS